MDLGEPLRIIEIPSQDDDGLIPDFPPVEEPVEEPARERVEQ